LVAVLVGVLVAVLVGVLVAVLVGVLVAVLVGVLVAVLVGVSDGIIIDSKLLPELSVTFISSIFCSVSLLLRILLSSARTCKLIMDKSIEKDTQIAPNIVKNCGKFFSIFLNCDDIMISLYIKI
jgi:ribose/xylose/arabinose/galactoside ABC-type transport system permease subunit